MKVSDIREARLGLANPRATSRIVLAALAVFCAVAFGATPAAAAWTNKQIAAHQRYLACKAELQKHPPCNNNWNRQCVLRCHGRLI